MYFLDRLPTAVASGSKAESGWEDRADPRTRARWDAVHDLPMQ